MILWLLAMAPVDPLAGATWTARITSFPAGCYRDAELAVEARRGDLTLRFVVPGAGIVGLGSELPVVVAQIGDGVTARADGGVLDVVVDGDVLAVHAVVDRWAGLDLQITGFEIRIPLETVDHPTCPGAAR